MLWLAGTIFLFSSFSLSFSRQLLSVQPLGAVFPLSSAPQCLVPARAAWETLFALEAEGTLVPKSRETVTT